MTTPLNNIRILDLTTSYSGPIATMQLADFGAEVIKVEHYKSGDFSRKWEPKIDGKSLFYPPNNRNKKSITLNLKSPEGKEIFKKLVKDADVVVENYRGGTMNKLGLGYDVLKEINPSIIMASLSGFGQTGPYSKRGAYSNIAEAMAGTMYMTGFPDTPVGSGAAFGDSVGGMFTALGIMLALFHREKTGEGQYIDVAMTDSLIALLEGAITAYDITGEEPVRNGNREDTTYPYDVFEAKDGFCFLTVTDVDDWTNFAKACELDHLLDDPRFGSNVDRIKNADILSDYINGWTREHTKAEIAARFDQYNEGYSSVNSIRDVINDEQVNAREMVVDVFDPEWRRSYKMAGIPIKMSLTPGEIKCAAPAMGQHNEEIYGKLGYSAEGIKELKEKEII